MSGTAPGLARRVTDLLEPKNWIIGLTLAIGWQAGHLTGVAWGCFGALFAAIGPIAFIKWGMRAGHWRDRHVGVKTHRLIVMIVIIASVATAITVMIIARAPQEMTALIAAMLTTLAALMAITTAWKISVHSAVSAGAAAMLVITFGPWLTAAYALVALVGWSRVALGDHTRAQVIAGALLGTAVAAATYGALS
jgi:membrane-associated phospholipid phosphatase